MRGLFLLLGRTDGQLTEENLLKWWKGSSSVETKILRPHRAVAIALLGLENGQNYIEPDSLDEGIFLAFEGYMVADSNKNYPTSLLETARRLKRNIKEHGIQ